MILVSGFNVYPNEVEAVLAAHPGVAEVRGHRRARRGRGRGGRARSWSARTRRSPRPSCASTAGSRSPPTRCRGSCTSAPTCRSRRSARCCARTCGTWPRPRPDRQPPMDPVCHSLAGLAMGQAGLAAPHAAGPADAGARRQRARHRRGHHGHRPTCGCTTGAAGRTGPLAWVVLPLALTGADAGLGPARAPPPRTRRRRRPGPARCSPLAVLGTLIASAARLHEQLRHPAADAVLGPVVLRRRALHRRSRGSTSSSARGRCWPAPAPAPARRRCPGGAPRPGGGRALRRGDVRHRVCGRARRCTPAWPGPGAATPRSWSRR